MQVLNNIATLQKLNSSKFMSSCYEVPLHMLYKSIPDIRKNYYDWDYRVGNYSDDDDEDDDISYNVAGENVESANHDIAVDPTTHHSEDEIPVEVPLRTSARHHREPTWLSSDVWVRD